MSAPVLVAAISASSRGSTNLCSLLFSFISISTTSFLGKFDSFTSNLISLSIARFEAGLEENSPLAIIIHSFSFSSSEYGCVTIPLCAVYDMRCYEDRHLA